MNAFALASLLLIPPAYSQEKSYEGAESILKKIESASSAKFSAGTGQPSPAELAEFERASRSMTPEDAAKGWLALANRQFATESRSLGADVSFSDLVAALPPTAAWPLIAANIRSTIASKPVKAKSDNALLLFAGILDGSADAQWAVIAQMRPTGAPVSPQERAAFATIYKAMAEFHGDGPRLVRAIDFDLASQKTSIQLPDIAAILGREQASAILRKILTQSKAFVYTSSAATKNLTRKVALESIASHKVAHWELVDSPEAVELYEAIRKRFKPRQQSESAYLWLNAAGNYMVGLIFRGRTAEAAKVADAFSGGDLSSSSTELLRAAQRNGKLKEFAVFLENVLSHRPDLKLWNTYVTAMGLLGRTKETIVRIEAAMKDPKTNAATKDSLESDYVSALLSADRIDDAVAYIRNAISNKSRQGGSLGTTLAGLGVVLKRNEWIDEGIAAVNGDTGMEGYFGGLSEVPRVTSLLLKAGRGPDAERFILDTLLKGAKQTSRYPEMGETLSTIAASVLESLLLVYGQAGRHQDVLALLERSPDWGAADLKDLSASYTSAYYYSGGKGLSANLSAYYAAAALYNVGRKQDAERVLLWALYNANRAHDPSYSLLLELKGEQAIPILDRLQALDQFEERPLIWKATMLHRLGRDDEAERTIRAAIAIDPSDGEQGKGDRLRAYAVLADILVAKGDSQQAAVMRGAVMAIREAEDADDFFTAGLITRSIQMYEKSLRHFQDAYCIQSRLAVQLYQAGRFKEAEEHYRRAYELMPDSFGRMESHCFGCEGVFDGELAGRIAEKVFSDLAQKQPEKPQVHYLLGYLRQDQGRYAEAVGHYETAVKLDPDYINAWRNLDALGAFVSYSKDRRDRIASALLRLDPLSRHRESSSTEQSTTNLKEVWETVDNALGKFEWRDPKIVLELPASAGRLRVSRSRYPAEVLSAMTYRTSDQPQTPSRTISTMPVFRAFDAYLSGSSFGEWVGR